MILGSVSRAFISQESKRKNSLLSCVTLHDPCHKPVWTAPMMGATERTHLASAFPA